MGLARHLRCYSGGRGIVAKCFQKTLGKTFLKGLGLRAIGASSALLLPQQRDVAVFGIHIGAAEGEPVILLGKFHLKGKLRAARHSIGVIA
jgi:hypothetical protein